MIPNGLFLLFIYLLNISKLNWKDNLIRRLQLFYFLEWLVWKKELSTFWIKAVNFFLPEYTLGICKETTIQGPSYQVSARGKQHNKIHNYLKTNFFSFIPTQVNSVNELNELTSYDFLDSFRDSPHGNETWVAGSTLGDQLCSFIWQLLSWPLKCQGFWYPFVTITFHLKILLLSLAVILT